MSASQRALVPQVHPTPARVRGLALRFPVPAAEPVLSDAWSSAGWRIRFARLGAGHGLALPRGAEAIHVKVIAGALSAPPLRAFPAAGTVRDTRCLAESVCAGGDGAWIAVIEQTSDVPEKLRTMGELAFRGPLAEHLAWEPFAKRFAGITRYFDGADAHIAAGFHLLDERGVKVAYVHFWTAGKGVDLSTHDHGNAPSEDAPTFAEVHWVLANGTGHGAMYRCSAPGSAERERTPMKRGTEHGPFFRVANGRPQLRENGAVDYPWHGWQAGRDAEPGQAYDFVCAFEINPDFVRFGESDRG